MLDREGGASYRPDVTPHERLADWLRTLPESQTATAARLGCSTSYLSKISHGRATPGREIANAIARASAGWREGPIRAEEWDEAAATPDDGASTDEGAAA